jgi:hypothetical protein
MRFSVEASNVLTARGNERYWSSHWLVTMIAKTAHSR